MGVSGGIDPKVWGSGAWGFLHAWTWKAKETLTRSDVERYAQLIAFFGTSLPCVDCRKHFAKLLLSMPLQYPEIYSRDTLFRWTYDAHKAVNDRLGFSSPSYEESRKFMEKLESQVSEGGGCGTGDGCRVSAPPPTVASDTATPPQLMSPQGSVMRPAKPSATTHFPLAGVIAVSIGIVVAAAIAIGVTASVSGNSNSGGTSSKRTGRMLS